MIIDFNHSNPSEAINQMIDMALVTEKKSEQPRDYLGGSRLGHDCERQLQFEYLNTPRDTPLTGKNCKHFEIGHILEDMIARWLKLAGFELIQVEPVGQQLGKQFEATYSIDGFEKSPIRMHRDGIIVSGPPILDYPCLWECKGMMNKYWIQCRDKGLMTANPDYYGQVQVYQKCFALNENPALFTAINKDTFDLYHEKIDHTPAIAQKLLERGERIVKACRRGALLPRIASNPSFYKCKPGWCAWSTRCWAMKN